MVSSRGLGAADYGLALLLVASIVLGGGGSPAPLPELLLEWMALGIAVALAWLDRDPAPWPRLALGFAAAILLLPALQLVPLPPALWRALPGRDVEIAALALVGAETRWMPWSMSPPRTLAALLALTVPAMAVVLAARASLDGRRLALAVLVATTLASAALGVAQLAGGPHSGLRFYAHSHVDNLVGFQANRNAQADVLLIGLLALTALVAGLPEASRRRWLALAAIAAAMLAGAVALTASRTGIALLVLGGIATTAWQARRLLARVRRRWVASSAAVVGMIAAAAGLLAHNPVLARIGARFAEGWETRPELWRDTVYAVGQYWPFGSGFGTFVPVFFAAERLEFVDASAPNRAHNDYLELALEAGLPGILLAAALAAVLLRRLKVAPASRHERAQTAFAGAVLVVLAAHSLVDYPLRSMALACVAGAAAGMILAPGRNRRGSPLTDREGTGRG